MSITIHTRGYEASSGPRAQVGRGMDERTVAESSFVRGDAKTAEELGLEGGATLHLVLALRGGMA